MRSGKKFRLDPPQLGSSPAGGSWKRPFPPCRQRQTLSEPKRFRGKRRRGGTVSPRVRSDVQGLSNKRLKPPAPAGTGWRRHLGRRACHKEVVEFTRCGRSRRSLSAGR